MRKLIRFIKKHIILPIFLPFKEALIDLPISMYKLSRRKKFISNLEYVVARLQSPHHKDLDERDRQYKIEAVKWLIEYYRGTPDFVADGSPETKLKKLLSKPTRDVTLRDHVYTEVLYYWKEHRRVEGF